MTYHIKEHLERIYFFVLQFSSKQVLATNDQLLDLDRRLAVRPPVGYPSYRVSEYISAIFITSN